MYAYKVIFSVIIRLPSGNYRIFLHSDEAMFLLYNIAILDHYSMKVE